MKKMLWRECSLELDKKSQLCETKGLHNIFSTDYKVKHAYEDENYP